MTITRQYIQNAIIRTRRQIVQIKKQIEKTSDPREIRRLIRRKRELQYLQLWHMDQLEQGDLPERPKLP